MYAYRGMPGYLKVFVLYLSASFISDYFGLYLMNEKMNNLWMFHLFTVVEYIILITMFSNFEKSKKGKNILLATIPVYILLVLIFLVFFENFNSWNNYSRSLSGFIILALAFRQLFALSKHAEQSLVHHPFFWIGGGLVFYFSVSVLFWAMSNFISQSLPLNAQKLIFLIPATAGMISNFLYAGGFSWQIREMKSGGY